MVYLSLCMIVKNEEKVLRRCLDSVKDIVDEIVIADTGSIDNTIKIASEYTDRIYNFEWTDSFSDARNFVQSKAKGKWILVLDADEYVDKTNLEAVKREIKQYDNDMDALGVTIYNFTGTGDQMVQNKNLRIYKNSREIRYERAIHEALVRVNGHLKTVMCALNIYHTGYLAEVAKSKDKRSRNTRLLEKQTQKSGNSSYDQFNLGNEFFSAKDMKKALESYQKSYASDKNSSWASFAVVQIIICLIELARYKEAISVIEDADKIWQDVPEFKYLRGQVYYLQ
ncbi:tetratricopeptide repeat-containing glycosyltransferase family 2 protein, partial [Ruminiclostridium cellobioparum]